MRVIGIGGPAAGRPRRRLGALLVTVAVAAGASVAAAAPAPAAAGTPFVYVANSGDNTVSVYDAVTGTVTATIAVGAMPLGVAVSRDGRTAYVANSGSSSVSVISTASNTVTATITVGAIPQAVAVSPDGGTVYTANDGADNVSVISTATRTVTGTIPVGGSPVGIAVSPDGSTVYVTNSNGSTVSVISTATSTVTATITAGRAPDAVAVSPDSSTVYVANEVSNTVAVIDSATRTVFATIPVGSEPDAVAVSPDGSTAYVANQTGNDVSVINAPTSTVATTIPVGIHPQGVAVSPDGGTVYVTNGASNTVSVISTATRNVTDIPVGRGPFGVAATTVPSALIPQVISFTPPASGTAGGQATLTASGGGSGNPVTFSLDPSSGAGVCQLSGTNGATVSYLAAGSCVIDANQAGNASYAPAPPVTGTVTVDQAPAFVMDTPPLTAVAGQPYGYAFQASGTPAPSYALAAGAPSWLTIDSATGQLAGTPPAGTKSFSYTVTAANSAGTATAGPFKVTVTRASAKADISTALSCPAAMTVGGTGTCTLTVANAGPAAAGSVTAAILLPPGLSEKSCSLACSRHGNAFTWTGASLASGASAKFTVTVRAAVPGAGIVLAAANSRSPDPDYANNIAAAKVVIARAGH